LVQHNKLVRDHIPRIIEAAGESCVARTLGDDEYGERLDAKLAEELAEYQQSAAVEELVDLVEVVQAIAHHRGITWEEFERQRERKRVERGGFAARQLLVSTRTRGE
jgi:predicted house-cleaning noncanonical NTP pyrophosphatase (MazG superfamily)